MGKNTPYSVENLSAALAAWQERDPNAVKAFGEFNSELQATKKREDELEVAVRKEAERHIMPPSPEPKYDPEDPQLEADRVGQHRFWRECSKQ